MTRYRARFADALADDLTGAPVPAREAVPTASRVSI